MERLVVVPTRPAGSPQVAHAGVLGSARAIGACMASPPHVLVFPFPVQGHINCLLHFATGLAAAGLRVTFLHTDYNLLRLGREPPAPDSPRLCFMSVPDGLPGGHPHSMRDFRELMEFQWTKCSILYRALLASLRAPRADADAGDVRRSQRLCCSAPTSLRSSVCRRSPLKGSRCPRGGELGFSKI
jgi:hypothetical protein